MISFKQNLSGYNRFRKVSVSNTEHIVTPPAPHGALEDGIKSLSRVEHKLTESSTNRNRANRVVCCGMPVPEEGMKPSWDQATQKLATLDSSRAAVAEKRAMIHLEEIKETMLGRVSGDDEVELGEIHR